MPDEKKVPLSSPHGFDETMRRVLRVKPPEPKPTKAPSAKPKAKRRKA